MARCFSLKALYYFALAAAGMLVCSNLAGKPTGYLHSWNQVTTLVLVRQLANDPSAIFAPREVVARITTQASSPEEKFLNYEEFPLYHLLSAYAAKLLGSYEAGSRIISIIFALIMLIKGRSLVSPWGRSASIIFTLLYLYSLLILYYGQAIMSDMAMCASGVWCVERALAWRSRQKNSLFLQSIVLLAVSTLFKSYGAIFLVPLAVIFSAAVGPWRAKLYRGSLLCLALFPVFIWHIFAAMQGGNQEIASHSFGAKLDALVSLKFYTSLFKHCTHIPGIEFLLLGLAGLLCSMPRLKIPSWLSSWLLALPVYAILTADKIPDHEYYLLPFAVPVLIVSALGIGALIDRHGRQRWFVALLLLAVLYHCGWITKSYLKATSENDDVYACAQEVKRHVEPGVRVASLSDIARYNSVIYYSNVEAFNVEETYFPLSSYVQEGAQYLLITVAKDRYSNYAPWLLRNNGVLQRIFEIDSLKDFKGKSRMCVLFKIASESLSKKDRVRAALRAVFEHVPYSQG